MKTIGLLGGMSWESTKTYYHLINEGIKARPHRGSGRPGLERVDNVNFQTASPMLPLYFVTNLPLVFVTELLVSRST
jgi:hypothetical protein